MYIDFETLSANQRYHLLTQTVIPRPIAWVLSQNSDQSLNLAPFSFFNAMCSEPPLMALSIGKKDTGDVKDTAINLLSGREFVIHIAHTKFANELNLTAQTLAYGESELGATNLRLANFDKASVPRLADCDIAYRCRLYDHHLIGAKQQTVIYAEVLSLYLSETVSESHGSRITVDANKVDPLSRLGAAQYAPIGQAFTVKRPK